MKDQRDYSESVQKKKNVHDKIMHYDFKGELDWWRWA